MQIPLDQFEQVIDEKILQRGLTYFKKGHVQELEEVSPNTYEAIVEGTEDYTVRLTVENNVVTDYNCDCPYDLGPVCKHVAAVIFSLQEEELGLTKKAAKSKKSAGSGTKKSKSVATQIDELMDKASVDELKIQRLVPKAVEGYDTVGNRQIRFHRLEQGKGVGKSSV